MRGLLIEAEVWQKVIIIISLFRSMGECNSHQSGFLKTEKAWLDIIMSRLSKTHGDPDRHRGDMNGCFPKVSLLLVALNKLGGQMLSKKQAWMTWQTFSTRGWHLAEVLFDHRPERRLLRNAQSLYTTSLVVYSLYLEKILCSYNHIRNYLPWFPEYPTI